MTLAGRCDRVLALIDEVLDAGRAATVDATAADDALVDPAAAFYSRQER